MHKRLGLWFLQPGVLFLWIWSLAGYFCCRVHVSPKVYKLWTKFIQGKEVSQIKLVLAADHILIYLDELLLLLLQYLNV